MKHNFKINVLHSFPPFFFGMNADENAKVDFKQIITLDEIDLF